MECADVVANALVYLVKRNKFKKTREKDHAYSSHDILLHLSFLNECTESVQDALLHECLLPKIKLVATIAN